MNKDLDREIGKKYYGNTVHVLNDLTPFIELAMTVDEMSKEGRVNDIRRVIANNYVEQRQKDLKAIGFHFGIPVKDIEKALQAKEFKDE